jgi:tetratricopeptide (TPR) repeat protein
LPAEGDDLKLASDLADRALKGDESPARLRWSRLTKGLAEYRSGRFQSAIEWVEKSRQLLPETSVPHLEAQTGLVLAMAHEGLGQTDKARQWLQSAEKVIDGQLPKSDGALGETWPDWIITQLLRSEAKRLLGRA